MPSHATPAALADLEPLGEIRHRREDTRAPLTGITVDAVVRRWGVP